MLSQTAEHALRAALGLAGAPREGPIQVGELSESLGIPRNYLSKILHRLTQEGVLVSTRGKGGGFELARPARRITLLDVVGPFDAFEPRRQCLLGRPVCSDARGCAAHQRWKDVSERVATFFRDTTLADLAG